MNRAAIVFSSLMMSLNLWASDTYDLSYRFDEGDSYTYDYNIKTSCNKFKCDAFDMEGEGKVEHYGLLTVDIFDATERSAFAEVDNHFKMDFTIKFICGEETLEESFEHHDGYMTTVRLEPNGVYEDLSEEGGWDFIRYPEHPLAIGETWSYTEKDVDYEFRITSVSDGVIYLEGFSEFLAHSLIDCLDLDALGLSDFDFDFEIIDGEGSIGYAISQDDGWPLAREQSAWLLLKASVNEITLSCKISLKETLTRR